MSAAPVSLVHANIISALVARRDLLGLSQHHLAQLLGTTQKQIHLFESGKRYGARGIAVCRRWRRFENFYADMGPRPKGRTLERVDNNGNYEPRNCVWASRTSQGRNTRTNALATIGGRTKSIAEWAEITGIPAPRLYARRAIGWADADLLLPLNSRAQTRR